jgi:CrcB protein
MTHTASIYLAVALGSALGGVGRFWVGGIAARFLGDTFPWGTYLVNVLGSGFVGFFAALTVTEGRFLIPASTRAFVMVGLCGGFTTFSTFSLETMNLARDGEMIKAAGNVTGTLVSCLIGVWCGTMLATVLNQE